MAVSVRLMQPEDARRFLEIHHESIRGIAAKDCPESVVDVWARVPINDAMVQRFLSNRDDEIRLIASVMVNPWASARSCCGNPNCAPATFYLLRFDVVLARRSCARWNESRVSTGCLISA
jgi:hypothetical protein